jgi:O-antigen ligase
MQASATPIEASPMPVLGARRAGLTIAAVLAAGAPALVTYEVLPSPTAFNHCLAVALWGLFVIVLKPSGGASTLRALLGGIGAMAAGVLASWLLRGLPTALALTALGLLAATAVLAWAGAHGARPDRAAATFSAFAIGWVVTGVASALIAFVQVFLPAWADDGLVLISRSVGRAVGNLRQPNLLGSLLVWAVISIVALAHLGRLGARGAFALVALLVFAIELSASRIAAVSLLLLAAWGVLDRRLARPVRRLLVATLVLYVVSFLLMQLWSSLGQKAMGAGARWSLEGATADSPNSRLNIWANTIELIRRQPWAGVGYGEFNLAWTLTPFPGRPTAFFDHAHSLPLQLAVELGLPLALLVLGALGWAFWQAWRRSRALAGDRCAMATAAWMMVAVIGLHSLVELPLWYAYFLLPAAFAWGFALGAPADPPAARPGRSGWLLGLMLLAGGGAAALDYLRVGAIFEATTVTLPGRIAVGQRSVFFAQKADYVAATTNVPVDRTLAFARVPHELLDTRLMIAWSNALAAAGRVDEARYLAARLREFRHPGAEAFFAPCRAKPAPLPFQCEAPVREHDWREFVQLPPR